MSVRLANLKPSERLRLLRIAIWQRRLNWVAVVALVWLVASAAIAFSMRPLLAGRNMWHYAWWPIYLPVWIALLIAYARLLRALGFHAFWVALLALSMTASAFTIFVPMIFLGAAGDRATRALAAAGIRVRFMGATPGERRRLFGSVCLACGYDLRGLPAGTCPERGARLTAPA